MKKPKPKKPKPCNILLLTCLILPGCSLMAKVDDIASKTQVFMGKVDEYSQKVEKVVDKAIVVAEEVQVQAAALKEEYQKLDTDKDGKVSMTELLAGLGGLLTAGGIAAAKLNASRKERTDELYEQTKAHEAELAALRAALGKPAG